MHLVDIINDIDRQDLRRTEGAFRTLVGYSMDAPIIGATPSNLTRALEFACRVLRNDTTLMPKATVESIVATAGTLPATTYQAGAATVGVMIDRWTARFGAWQAQADGGDVIRRGA